MEEQKTQRQRILDPVDRISEIVFGLLMAVSFTGAISVANAGREEVRTAMIAALGCNLAWGIVDAVMYVVRTQVAKGHELSRLRAIRAAADPARANALIRDALPGGVAESLADEVVDGLRRHFKEMPEPPQRPPIEGRELAAALAIFVLVVLSTFPVVLPFMLIDDARLAMRVSNWTAAVMLFFGGLGLGRYAGIGSWRTGVIMVVLGVAMMAAIMALGG